MSRLAIEALRQLNDAIKAALCTSGKGYEVAFLFSTSDESQSFCDALCKVCELAESSCDESDDDAFKELRDCAYKVVEMHESGLLAGKHDSKSIEALKQAVFSIRDDGVNKP